MVRSAKVIRNAAIFCCSILLLTHTGTAQAAFGAAELSCRGSLAKNGLKLATTASKIYASCHKKRAAGKLPSSTNCNDKDDADPKGKIDKVAGKLSDQAATACSGLTPDDLLYTGCPSPCATAVPSLSDFTDVAACIQCVVEDAAASLSAVEQGAPVTPFTESDDKKCHGTIGKEYTKHVKTILKERTRCQNDAEVLGAMDTMSCGGSDLRGKIAKVVVKGEAKLDKDCSEASLSAVQSCTDISLNFLKLCVFNSSDNVSESMFQSYYNLMSGGGGTTTTTTMTGGSTTTTTMGGGSQDPQCPSSGELTVIAAVTEESCTTNVDCTIGTCDPGLGACVTPSRLSSGWTGIAHGADVNNGVRTRANLLCPGPAPICGQCSVLGLNAVDTDICRCDGDNRTICDEPFQADADDCGGALCNCYFGPPLPLSAGNTPACALNRFSADVTGTANVDTGLGRISTNLRTQVFLGINLITPCPYCTGDITVGDGVRDGTCVNGLNNGASCDSGALNLTFPAPGGDGHSLDCFPDPGKNVSGTGLKIDITQTSGTADSISVGLECGFPPFVTYQCHCGICSGDPAKTTACVTNGDCSALGLGDCTDNGQGNPLPNQCSNSGVGCLDTGNNIGACDMGPIDNFCDGVLRANAAGFIACNTNVDCEPGTIGIDAGACTLQTTRGCFLDTITAQGVADASQPVGAATFCIPPTSNGGINTVAGLPGPAKVVNQGSARTFCDSNPAIEYTPGVGGCP